ncbi:uncharacterized protein EV154DRAFT_429625 [Mucor mucedo]|uniref:uncharacterized protein n=1 Tax=Mucor mucedo TaxID=29922 RepID=UPI00221E530C|nr:uncharacterized protein EV154DRAFT_429625 [Mucor mucedo]KAI7876806.1 hypothetical protein EV154DRAFT_429625 [Mucor mucedo]
MDRKAIHEFGDIFRLYRIFVTSTGLELPTDLSNKFGKEPEDWFHYYITKATALHATDRDVLMAQAIKEYEDAEKFLITFQDDINYSVLIQVASKMLWILDAFPSYAGSYYILSYLLYIVNRFEDALDVMDMGRLCSTSYPPFDGNNNNNNKKNLNRSHGTN